MCFSKILEKVKVKLIDYRVSRLNNSANKLLDNFLISFMLNDLWMCVKIGSKIRQDHIRDQIVTGG